MRMPLWVTVRKPLCEIFDGVLSDRNIEDGRRESQRQIVDGDESLLRVGHGMGEGIRPAGVSRAYCRTPPAAWWIANPARTMSMMPPWPKAATRMPLIHAPMREPA